MSSILLSCAFCQAIVSKNRKCGNCKSRTYCSVECQRSDWSEHKKECGSLKERFPDELRRSTNKQHKFMYSLVNDIMNSNNYKVQKEYFVNSITSCPEGAVVCINFSNNSVSGLRISDIDIGSQLDVDISILTKPNHCANNTNVIICLQGKELFEMSIFHS